MQIWAAILQALGVGVPAARLTSGEIALRAALVYSTALALVRLVDRRRLGKNTVFDVVLSIVLGSTFSRAINGGSPLGPTVIGCTVLVALHWLLAELAVRSPRVNHLVNGLPRVLVRDGAVQDAAMRRNQVGSEDLLEALRSGAQMERVDQIRLATLERNGTISVIPKGSQPQQPAPPAQPVASDAARQPGHDGAPPAPSGNVGAPPTLEVVRVVEVAVRDGVQVVRIELAPGRGGHDPAGHR